MIYTEYDDLSVVILFPYVLKVIYLKRKFWCKHYSCKSHQKHYRYNVQIFTFPLRFISFSDHRCSPDEVSETLIISLFIFTKVVRDNSTDYLVNYDLKTWQHTHKDCETLTVNSYFRMSLYCNYLAYLL